jgi:Flp pilus assembly pilin Flp
LEVDERVRNLRRSERGQAFVEYALVLLLVAVGVFAAADWGGLRTAFHNALTTIENNL